MILSHDIENIACPFDDQRAKKKFGIVNANGDRRVAPQIFTVTESAPVLMKKVPSSGLNLWQRGIT
jgi:hypothetical protein